MGRWLNKVGIIPDTIPSKSSKPGFEDFEGSLPGHFQEKNNNNHVLPKIDKKETLDRFVRKCCMKLSIEDSKVINELLSVEDEEDIIDGNLSAITLHAHIKTWINDGMPYYSEKKRPCVDLVAGKDKNYPSLGV